MHDVPIREIQARLAETGRMPSAASLSTERTVRTIREIYWDDFEMIALFDAAS